jgi:hypothetical protein
MWKKYWWVFLILGAGAAYYFLGSKAAALPGAASPAPAGS